MSDQLTERPLVAAESEASPTDSLHLFLLITDLKRTLAGQG